MRQLMLAAILCSLPLSASPCKSRGSYAYSTGNGHSVSISGGTTIEDFKRMRSRLGEQFFWVSLSGKSYAIRDAVFLAEVRDLFAPARAMQPEIDKVEREEEKLDEQMDALSDDDDKSNDAQIEPLRKQLDDVHKRERALDKKQDQLECEAEAKLWTLVDDAIKDGVASRIADRE